MSDGPYCEAESEKETEILSRKLEPRHGTTIESRLETPRATFPGTPADVIGGVPHFPRTLYIGEHVVGSSHDLEVMRIVNGEQPYGAKMMSAVVVVEDETHCREAPMSTTEPVTHVECETTSPFTSPTPTLQRIGRAKTLYVTFAPKAVGKFTAQLKVIVNWSDGSATTRQSQLLGVARQLNDPPLARPRGPSTDSMSSPTTEPADRALVNSAKPADLAELTHHANNAKDTAADLAKAQDLGVANAERNQQAYKRAVPPAPWWSELASLAISMGVAGVAGAVAQSFNQMVLGKMDDAIRKTARDSAWLKGVTDGVKDGIKSVGKAGVAGASNLKIDGGQKPFSTNARAEFFAQQTSILASVQSGNRKVIEKARYDLEPHVATDPKAAVEVMKQIETKLGAVRKEAQAIQQRHTEAQWIAGVAQSANGHAVAKTPDGARVNHSLLKGARNGRSRDGVLTIQVHRLDRDLDGVPRVQVHAASLHGVSQAIADNLREQRLHDVPLPIMLDVQGTTQARITRDEAGVVRVTAKRDREDSYPFRGDPETQNVLHGERLLAVVLARSLAAWGINQITTDDANED